MLDLPPDELRALGHYVWDRLVDRWEGLDAQPPIAPVQGPMAIPPAPDGPSDPRQAIDFLFDEVLPRGQRGDHPRFFARIGSPSNPISVLADLIGTGHNVFAGSWTGGAGASAMELAVVDWLRGWMGMPAHTEGILVSGGSVGTLTALAAAARAKAEDRDQATGYVQEHTHAAIAKAWRILGFNPANLRVLKADPAHRLQPAAIDAAVHLDREAGLQPFLVVGTAGATSTGSVDPLNDLADQAAREDLWFHVDGAYGGPARLTAQGAALLAGIERADSLVLDPHKWLFQPYEIGCVLVSHRGLLEATFGLEGAYLRDTENDHVQLRERGPQLTRSSRALKLWLSVTTFGVNAFRDAIAHGIALAEHAETTLARDPFWEVTSPATLGIVTFRPAHATDEETDAMVARAVADGFAAPSTTRLNGRVVARLCTINPRTTERDIEATIERLATT
ncbi:aminotransferase class V-fold PLP-dependent enzyme [Solirubrobacter phytolaccae]|uniref:Aminotransferase class V-fold PLP-dependent enzyme n=1 Tax=Solirubrobacter phytolaccae TaxID=1404360 RepID=A0A9X3S9W6_9ACTN|nr:aminotransferase class V-fold PLP-dependent enzyme [Solirubrobacter phytolaccae]MDA0179675.1 aminotransferase class V-fold PLP-dependent enzyme [Solirubrobacter phytolaccae]